MYIRQHKTSGKHSHSSDSQSFGFLDLNGRSRFVSQSQSEQIAPQYNSTPDLQAKANEDQPFSSGYIDGSVFSRQVDRPQSPGIQFKLQVGQSGDKYEQEVDRMAANVVEHNGEVARLKEQSTQGHSGQHQDVTDLAINNIWGNGLPLIQRIKTEEITSTLEYNGASKATVIKLQKSRPAYADGQVEAVWDAAPKDDQGRAICPNTGKLITWEKGLPRSGVWDMGHKPGHEYKKLVEKLGKCEINYATFLAEYQNPNNYQVEDCSANRSHKFES